MATIKELCDKGELFPVRLKPSRRLFEDRKFYAYPRVWEWLNGPLKSAKALDSYNASPAHQAFALFQQFISGAPLNAGKQFKRMLPKADDVFEFVTPDIRFFGWFYKRDCFIAVF